MLVSKQLFDRVFPYAVNGIYEMLDEEIKGAGCITKTQQAMFLAQCGVETGGFKVFSENLNYSAKGLLAVFPKYFNPTTAQQCARKPQTIANIVYANRLGNGNSASGDGWKYRGVGMCQLTGKDNFNRFCRWLGRTVTPDDVRCDLRLIVKTAIFFWVSNRVADLNGDVLAVTKRVNGGTHGLQARQEYFKRLIV